MSIRIKRKNEENKHCRVWTGVGVRMPEQNAGSIAVELALKSSSFERQMKHAAAAVKGIDEEFKVSKAEADAENRGEHKRGKHNCKHCKNIPSSVMRH